MDSSHLEKMGRELKCPICLNLLDSAVSLTCNHVFCNLCIEKSMKSASECPVCKVPFRRREVCPASHMDNLVSIYKSMEVASHVNVSVTQTGPSNKLSGGENQPEADMVSGQDENCKLSSKTTEPQNQRRLRQNRSKGSSKINLKKSSSDPVRPSFPTKKRVQVAQHPPPETPTQPAKHKVCLGEHNNNGQTSSVVQIDKPVSNKSGDLEFCPFFWLQEEDAEKCSQPTDGDMLTDTSPVVPSFSDIKDSDDEHQDDMTTENGPSIASRNVDLFDSEMFEWTQRACSPELCSGPMTMQVEDTDQCDGILLMEDKAPSLDTAENMEDQPESRESSMSRNGTDKMALCLAISACPETNYIVKQGRSSKRSKKASECYQNKQAKRTKGICIDSNDEAEDNIQEEKCHIMGSPGKASNLKGKPKKRVTKVCLDPNVTESKPECTCTFPVGAKPLNQSSTIAQQKGDCTRRSEPQKTNNAPDVIVPSQNNDILISNSPKSFIRGCDSKVFGLGVECRENKIGSLMDPKCDKKAKCSKRVTFFTDDRSNHDRSSAEKIQSLVKVQGSSDDSSILEKACPILKGFLRKCEENPKKLQCLFCQSMEDSEASGDMVHYLNGKPVAADYIGGANIVHVHKNCAEWAPNVYFEDDNAINLEAELARGRRIKCGCCGLKGAALGCFEKSCRRSFHVPCAKLTPQCRWDNDNFVMLCPLHASLKLPNEISESQPTQKRKCLPKRQIPIHQAQGVVKRDGSASSCWNTGFLGKLVLCCSALTIAEKETVSEFERLSGVTVLKNWDPSVTHVIASTDENRACRRTLKVLMGILEGKWILSIEWVKACLEAMEKVDEQRYEIHIDIHGIRDGPRLGRLRHLNKQPKLFDGCWFYFAGDFQPSYKGYLHELVIAAGGKVLHRKPISGDNEALSSTFIIYSLELPDKCKPSSKNLIINRRRSDAETLARSCQALVASNSWILNSISACKLQNLGE